MQTYFDQLDRVRYEGPKSTNPLAFRHYNPDELVLGKRMEDHLRFAACYWHTFCWNGADMFGVGSFDRPWQQPGDALEMAKRKADVAFEFSINSTCLTTASTTLTSRRKALPSRSTAITSPGWSRCWLRNSSRAA
ncbi:xylose isomerase [Klebsiella pneumoniae]|uniref:xylose isomerase n=1 Tax=Klebsiella pneumoniae TaxID=573 RepID=A0A4P0YIJ9_KLEPN|nr:xylose isomerase [Klebsiella pneumoniae]